MAGRASAASVVERASGYYCFLWWCGFLFLDAKDDMRYIPGRIALLTIPLCLWLTGCAGSHSVRTGDDVVSQGPPETAEMRKGFAIPDSWTRRGLVLERQRPDQGVSGDPCIVWDEAIRGWRMVLFCDPWGHAQSSAECGVRNAEWLIVES
jgi:hypothetical protein